MYLADFSKTNLTKFAVISEKKSPKGRFLKFEKLQNHTETNKQQQRQQLHSLDKNTKVE